MSWAEFAKQRGDLQRSETAGRQLVLQRRETFLQSRWVDFDRERIELLGRERRARSEREARAAADAAAAERVQAARRRIVRDEQKTRIVLREIVSRAYRELEQLERESFRRTIRQGGSGQGAGDSYRPCPLTDRRRRKPTTMNETVSPTTRATTAEAALRMLADSVAKASSPERNAGPVTVSVASGGEFRYVIPASSDHAAGVVTAADASATSAAQYPAASASAAVLMFVPNGVLTSESSTYPRAARLDRLDATQRECDRSIRRLQVVIAAATVLQRCGRGHVARSGLVGAATSDDTQRRELSQRTLKSEPRGDGKRRQDGTGRNSVAAMVALRKFERDFSIPAPTELKRPKSVSPQTMLSSKALSVGGKGTGGMLTPHPSVAAMVRRDSTVRARVARTDSRIVTRTRPLSTSLIADSDLQKALDAVSPIRQRGEATSSQTGDDETAGGDHFFHLGASLQPLEGNIGSFVNRVMRMTPAERSYQRQERLRLMEVRQRAVDTEVFDRSHALKQAEVAAAASKAQRGVKSTARLESHRLLRGRRRLEEARTKAAAVAAEERARFLEQEAAEMRAVSRHVQLRQSILAEDAETALSHTAARVPGAAKHISAVQREVVKAANGGASRVPVPRPRQTAESRDGLSAAIDVAERDTLRRSAPRPDRTSAERSRSASRGKADDVSIPPA